MEHQDFGAVARTIMDSIVYMVLGTANETGNPWASPVYFSSEKYKEFYWMSSPQALHSRNLLQRPQVSIVIFDSRIPVGSGQAVYMSAVAEELTGSELARGIEIYNGRVSNPADHGVHIIAVEDVQPPALYRLYRAIAHEAWVLDPSSHPNQRIPVSL
jgi:uncharacterized protein YhbP (UPF0306 family)